MSDIIKVLNSLHFELKRREAQVERRGDKGKKYCRDRLTIEADPKNREQIKALKRTYERGWKQAADELTYFEELFDEAVEWCADETEFTHQQVVKAFEVQFHPSRLKPADRLFYQSVQELMPALKNLPPDKWRAKAWAQSDLTPKRMSGANSKRKQQVTTSLCKLIELDKEVLLALGDLKATAKDDRVKADDVGAKVEVGKDRFYVKESLAKLTNPDYGYVASHQGRNGGSWLTSKGRGWFKRQRR